MFEHRRPLCASNETKFTTMGVTIRASKLPSPQSGQAMIVNSSNHRCQNLLSALKKN